ncbi:MULTISPECIES: C40 family peptidase [Mycobacteroides]|jgi:cell wall-associated NlpC family hydrolase|uniref:Hydrolase n=1 Tax=Mycobacteroides chelonae TaxID=1774 RepID=A0A1S1LLH4_MYCCH|nr:MULTISPECIES: C40 family peptidase [Mycobacteroides]SKM34873.1 endopeptidase YddH [Mycobacteroides abscessus subsp. bolletii]KRQ18334.1 hydrolase [Mycobacteroides sp. H003]KRQ20320.1 hydrolase [Mycobacteroides sp. H092]KRQ33674.1 hydrolase [Mycobacteroides sp. H101]KRQ45167.1 hydrolase [Mycobacteroides sp. H063]
MVETSPISPSRLSEAVNTNYPSFENNPFSAGLIGPAMDMAGTVGNGQFKEGQDPSKMLEGGMQVMQQVMQQGMQAGSQLIGTFAGAAAQALGQFAGMAGQALSSMATRSGAMGANVGQASESTGRASALIGEALQEFQHTSEALTPLLWVPGVAAELAEAASRCTARVAEHTAQLEGELAGQAGELTGMAGADMGNPSTPASGSVQPAMSAMQGGLQAGTQAMSGVASGVTQTMSSMGQGLGQIPQALTGMLSGGGASGASSALGGANMSGIAAGALANPFGAGGGHASSTAGGTSSGLGSSNASAAKMLLDPRSMGKGAQLFLPDGSTSQAPNAAAAEAVRKALSQVGVPYEWGGTKPGVGLDCSGLTQWAYGESGVDIPRLAQEQGVGVRVDQGSVMPGDLAVWDGHVAMVIGNGMMVEAGDPVQISPIRTTNAGQGFHGFYRPTS